MKKWKKKIKQKKKSKSPGNDNEKQKEIPKEIGLYHDFLVFDKNDKNSNLEFQDCHADDPSIKDWLILYNSPLKTKSRFSNLFEEILESNKKPENKQNNNIMNKEENDNIINEDDKNNNNIIINKDNKKSNINNDDNDKNIINKDDNKNIIDNKVKNDNEKNNQIINEEENNKSDKNNIMNLENEDYNNINKDINNIINNINNININSENESENENYNDNNNNIFINNNKDNDFYIRNNNDNNNININDLYKEDNRTNSERNYSEALTKTTTIDSNKLMLERNPSELSLSSNYNVNFPLISSGSLEQNNILYNNNVNLYGKNSLFNSYSSQQDNKKSIFSHYSGNEYKPSPSIYSSSSGNNSRNESEINISSSIKSNFSLFERNSSVEKFQPPERKIIELNVDMKKVICLEDIRTTIMIKNIPNKFNRDLLLKIIDQNFKGAYDLFILPTDVNRYKNFGYAFINFTCSYYIPYFYGLFNGKKWGNTNSQKICEITYSKIQGKNNLLSHYSNKIIFRNDDVKKYDIDQKFIIPNVYKEIFNKAYPNYNIEEFKYYFITKMPIKY